MNEKKRKKVNYINNKFLPGGPLDTKGVLDNPLTRGTSPVDNLRLNSGYTGPSIERTYIGSSLEKGPSFNIDGAMEAIGVAGNIASGLSGIISAGVNNSKIADTTELEQSIKNRENYISSANSNDELMNEWSSLNPLNYVDRHDVRGISSGQQVGNTLSGALSGASAGMMFGPIGAAVGGLAGLASGLFGSLAGDSKARKKAREINYNTDIVNLRNNETMNIKKDALDRQMDLDLLYNYAAYGGPINIKKENRGKFTESANRAGMGVQEYARHILANKDDYSSLLVKRANFSRNAAKWHALGGPLQSNGIDWTNGLSIIGNGGTHSSNPLGGVQHGVDNQGIPNLVEEGEVIYNDYVFSNRVKANKDILKTVGLPEKYNRKSFSDIAKALQKESEERPNDPISKRSLEDSMNKLTAAQEEIKMIEQKEVMENNKFGTGGDTKPKDDGVFIPSLLNPDTPENQRSFMEGALPYIFDELLKLPEFKNDKEKTIKTAQQIATQYALESNFGRSRIAKDKFNFTGWRAFDKDPYNNASSYLNIGDFTKKYGNNLYTGRYHDALIGDNFFSDIANLGYAYDPEYAKKLQIMRDQLFTKIVREHSPNKPIDTSPFSFDITPYERVSSKVKKDLDLKPDLDIPSRLKRQFTALDEDKLNPNTLLRQAPIIGSSISALTDALGLTNKPDYTNADKLIQEASKVYNQQPIEFTPLGNKLSYNPIDSQYLMNKLGSSSAANRRAIRDMAGGNRATAMANLLVNDYNTINQMGELGIKLDEANQARRERIAAYNQNIDRYNSEGLMRTAMANADMRKVQDATYLDAITRSVGMKDALDAQSSAAKSANLSNLFNNLGALGKERAIEDMIRENPFFLYGPGSEGYKAAKGGYLTIKNKRRRK